MTDVLVVAELLEGKPKKASYMAASFAKQAAEGTGGVWDMLVIGEGAEAAAQEMVGYGARKIITAEIAGGYYAEKYAPTAAKVAKDGGYGVITATGTAFGKDLIPRVAAKLQAGYAADIIGVEASEPLKYRRALYAGNVRGTLTLSTDVQAVTLRASEFDAIEQSGGSSPIEKAEVVQEDVAGKIEFVSQEVVQSERPDLTEADIVVSGGRALKSADNFKNVLEPLVDALGAGMGASRAACDAGYVANDLQIGQTGKVVAPNLYIAVGISGAIQHLAGMKGSKTIVAINKDKEAPIASVADYFLVADLFDAVPALTEEVKKVKQSG